MGQRWLDDISAALASCRVEIVICSCISVKKPWINFEAGAGWVRGIPVIPLCHSGIVPSGLPVPLNLLQAASATDVSGLKLIFPVLANAIGSQTPNVDFTDFIVKVKDFESRYTFWKSCKEAFSEIQLIDPVIIDALKSGKTVTLDLSEIQIKALEAPFKFLTSNDLLLFERVGDVKFTNIGTLYGCVIQILPGLSQIITDKNFKY